MLEEIIKIICEQLSIDESEITVDSDIMSELGADSLDVVELVAKFEERYALSISDEEIMDIRTVYDIQRYIETRL